MNVSGAFGACRTPADFYRLQIALENECAPVEILARVGPKERLPLPARKWIERLEGMMRSAGESLQPFERISLSENVQLYRMKGKQAAARSLILGFCGNFQRLMVPLPIFLQHIPADDFDVVVFRDPTKMLFLRGIPNYVPGLGELPARLARDLSLESYETLRCLGTSAGGAAALAAGAALGAERAFAYGGAHPYLSEGTLPRDDADLNGFDPIFRESACLSTRFRAFFGAQNQRDRENAASLAGAFKGVRMAEVPGVAGHNMFYELFERGELAGFLGRTLLGDIGTLEAMQTCGPSPAPVRRRGKRREFSLARLRHGWERFGGLEQFGFWCARLCEYPRNVFGRRRTGKKP
jgi:hypothetical protein